MPLRALVACAYVLLALSIPRPLLAQDGDFRVTLAADVGGKVDPTFGSFNHHVALASGVLYASFMYTDAQLHSYIWIKSSRDGGRTWTDFFTPGQGARVNDQPAVIAADKHGRLHVAWCGTPGGYGNYMVFVPDASGTGALNPQPALWRTDVGECNSKFSLVYNEVDDCMHWSRRDFSGDMYVYTLFVSDLDSLLSLSWQSHLLVTAAGACDGDLWDAQYQSMTVDPHGRLHMIYNPHRWRNGCQSPYERVAVLYMRSDDLGDTWQRADGTEIALPLPADDLENGGTVISASPTDNWGTSINSNERAVYICWLDSLIHVVALDARTGARLATPTELATRTLGVHTSIVTDRATGNVFVSDGVSAYCWHANSARWITAPLTGNLHAPPDRGRHFTSASGMASLIGGDGLGFLVTDIWHDAHQQKHKDVVFQRLATALFQRHEYMVAEDVSFKRGSLGVLAVSRVSSAGCVVHFYVTDANQKPPIPTYAYGALPAIPRAVRVGTAVADASQVARAAWENPAGLVGCWQYFAVSEADCQVSTLAELCVE